MLFIEVRTQEKEHVRQVSHAASSDPTSWEDGGAGVREEYGMANVATTLG